MGSKGKDYIVSLGRVIEILRWSKVNPKGDGARTPTCRKRPGMLVRKLELNLPAEINPGTT